jgi:hypothetical protein
MGSNNKSQLRQYRRSSQCPQQSVGPCPADHTFDTPAIRGLMQDARGFRHRQAEQPLELKTCFGGQRRFQPQDGRVGKATYHKTGNS